MRRLTAIRTAVFLLLLVAVGTTAFAATEYKYSEGKCPSGNEWWCVTRFENGTPTFVQGVNCKGQHYYYHVGRVVASSNPIDGMTPTHTGSCDAGAAIITWASVLQLNSDAEPSWIAGQACDGTYYVATDFTAVDPGAGPGGGGQ